MKHRYALAALALLFSVNTAFAQAAEEQTEPEVVIRSTSNPEYNVTFNNLDGPLVFPQPPYGPIADSSVSFYLGASVFQCDTNGDGDATESCGTVYSVPGATGPIQPALPVRGCEAITNNVTGRIALIERGSCGFSVKAQNAMDAGAVGVVVYNCLDVGDPAICAATSDVVTGGMSAGPDLTRVVTIPIVYSLRGIWLPVADAILKGSSFTGTIRQCTDGVGVVGPFGPCTGAVANEPGPDGVPGTYVLSAAYPNPFNPSTQFTLEVATTQDVTVEVFNALGQRVALLHEGALGAGVAHQFTFEAGTLPSGVYLYRATGESFSQTRRMVLQK